MNNGCVCCTVRGDLIRVVAGLMKRQRRASPPSTPSSSRPPAWPTPARWPRPSSSTRTSRPRPSSTASPPWSTPNTSWPGSTTPGRPREQVAFADRIILNKTDLVTRGRTGRRRGAPARAQPAGPHHPRRARQRAAGPGAGPRRLRPGPHPRHQPRVRQPGPRRGRPRPRRALRPRPRHDHDHDHHDHDHDHDHHHGARGHAHERRHQGHLPVARPADGRRPGSPPGWTSCWASRARTSCAPRASSTSRARTAPGLPGRAHDPGGRPAARVGRQRDAAGPAPSSSAATSTRPR